MAKGWEKTLVRRGGTLVGCSANVEIILSNVREWKDVIAFDDFVDGPTMLKKPDWEGWDLDQLEKWTDDHTASVRVYLARDHHLIASFSEVQEGVRRVARRKHVHPVRDYLKSLKWDKKKRLDEWLIKYAGVVDTVYARAVGAKFLISAIARVFQPGCIARAVPILEGEQLKGKSTLLRNLVPNEAWFLETGIDLGGLDSFQILRGKWLIELAELDSLARSELSRVKAYISNRFDTYRKSYGVGHNDYPRQCVFAGTTNSMEYLKDDTGATRFWPVRISKIDIAGLVAVRDQLWAEAVARYKAGETWYLDDPKVQAFHALEAEERRQADTWEPAIVKWLADNRKESPENYEEGVTTYEILTKALEMEIGRTTRGDEMRVGSILRLLGWNNVHRAYRSKTFARIWRKDPLKKPVNAPFTIVPSRENKAKASTDPEKPRKKNGKDGNGWYRKPE